MKEERIIVISEVDILKARRVGREIASELGFNEISATEIEIAISELATNLIKHRAIHGEIILKAIKDLEKVGLEVRAEDKGPGIKNLSLAMKNGESTAGTLGIGLSGVKRLMDEFSIESIIRKGTIVIAKKWLLGRGAETSPKMKFSVMGRPKPGEDVSGDAYFIKETKYSVIFALMDVLGHGREAYDTTLIILKILEDHYTESLKSIIDICHKGLKHTRGAAMALCRVDFGKKILEHISIGNVETRIYGTPEPLRPFCFNGTLGMAMENYRVIEYPYSEGLTILIFSDGISGKFDLSPQLLSKSPQEISSFIFDHYASDYDDATVLVGR